MIANTIFLLADNFRTFGVGVYVVQVQNLRREALQSAFTVTLALSLVTAAALSLLAGPLARFYAEPELGHLVSLSTLAFLVIPFASPIVALLQREMAFRQLALINLGAAATGFVVTVSLGFAGAGPVSYVWGFVAQGLALALLAVAVRPDTWIFRLSTADCRRILSFGAISSGSTVVNMAFDMLPRLAFGKILGFDAVGLYGRALNICQIPDRAIASALQPVVLPAMAAHARAGGDLRESWLRGHALMSAVQWPTLAMLALLADPVVRLLLGSQWGEAAPLVRIIAFAMMALAPAFMTFPVLVASGRIRDTLMSSLIVLPPSAAISIGAAFFGLTAVALSLFVTAPAQMLVALFFVRRAIGLSWPEIVRASRESVAITAGTALVPAAVILLSPNGFALGWGETAVAVLGGAVGWIATLWAIDHPLRSEIVAVRRMAMELLARRRAVPPPAE
jgi:O-antigen/teichoic acid export membrane protein